MAETERRVVRVLPETVANQIAAGEVVERPASVVKELVENALDAGATRIEISVEQGGARLVEVDDNGCGMDREDALLSLERQATSKIATSADIEHISTFGFRGEAIPSIASVSRFTLITRPATQDGATEINVIGGTLDQVTAAGRPVGTTVTVRDLFFNVPARRKFLRAASTELTRIRAALTAIALAHPDVAFRLRADGRDLFQLPEGDTLEDRARALLGDPTADAFLTIDHTREEIHVHGYVTQPAFVRGGTPEQYIFINQRPATAPQIQYALREAWPEKGQRPVVVLFIDLPPEEVDVNVHPAKREVRFRRGNRVSDAVMAAIAMGVADVSPVPAPDFTPPPAPSPFASAPRRYVTPIQPVAPVEPVEPAPPAPAPLSPIAPMPRPQAPTPFQSTFTPPPAPPQSFVPQPEPEVRTTCIENALWKWSRVADVLEQDYWLVVTDRGTITVDAKAALERILYERLAKSTEGTVASQPLLIPETLQLPPADAERVSRFLPELEACGFGLSAFGRDTFLVDALPIVLATLPPKEVLADLAVELDRTGVKKGMDTWRREVVARAAAKAACGAFHSKDIPTAEKLLGELAACEMPYVTPRGRPVMILTSYRELARRFQRE